MVKELNVKSLEKDARSIAEMLATHKVFGVVTEEASPKEKAVFENWIAHEKEHFVGMVLRQALDQYALGSMKLNYNDTGVLVEFDIQVICNTALFSFVRVVPALEVTPNIDYEALVADIQFVQEYNIVE